MGTTNAFYDKQPITLPPRMDIGSFEAIAKVLRQRPTPDLHVDAGEVTHLGAIGLQLLLAASQDAAKRGGGFHVHNPSPSFARAMTDFGLTGDVFGAMA